MSSPKANFIGKDIILEAFERKAKTPYFAVFDGRKCHEWNDQNDFEISVNLLDTCIDDMITAGNDRIFVIKLYSSCPKEFKYNDNTIEMYCQLPLKTTLINHPAFTNESLILQKLNELESKINAIPGEEVEEEEDKSALGKLTTILDHPIVQQFAPILITGLASMFGVKENQNNNIALAGVDPETELHEALNLLFSKGVTLEHIKKLSALPKEKITMLLSML